MSESKYTRKPPNGSEPFTESNPSTMSEQAIIGEKPLLFQSEPLRVSHPS
jgi:hypothetical protein